MYLVLDDLRNGLSVLPPSKRKFLFKPSGRTRTTKVSGRYAEVVYNHFCTCPVTSKKDVEWLRQHTRYGIDFFENANEAISMDMDIAQIAASMLINLESASNDEIIRRAKDMGIAIGEYTYLKEKGGC